MEGGGKEGGRRRSLLVPGVNDDFMDEAWDYVVSFGRSRKAESNKENKTK